MRLIELVGGFVVVLGLFGCDAAKADAGNEDDAAKDGATKKKKKKKKKGGKTNASASAAASAVAPPDPPELAAVKAGMLKDPSGGPDAKLTDVKLDKCYGFKGYTMRLPEGTRLQTLVGARACAVYPPQSKKDDYGFIVMSDELKVQVAKKEDIEGVKAKPFDEPDAFLWEVERKGKTYAVGWTEMKIGPHTIRCNSFRKDDKSPDYGFDTERALLEVCRGITYNKP